MLYSIHIDATQHSLCFFGKNSLFFNEHCISSKKMLFSTQNSRLFSGQKTHKPLIYKGKKANFKFALGVCQSKELMIF